jgi:hypothetical protein
MWACGPYLLIRVEFIITDTLKPEEQRVIKGSWAGNTDANRHIGQEACEQEELRGFTRCTRSMTK